MLAASVLVTLLLLVSLIIVWPSISLRRRPFSAPEASYHSWDEILSHPQPITIRTYVAGVNQTTLSGIMNLKHEQAQGIEDKVIDIPERIEAAIDVTELKEKEKALDETLQKLKHSNEELEQFAFISSHDLQ